MHRLSPLIPLPLIALAAALPAPGVDRSVPPPPPGNLTLNQLASTQIVGNVAFDNQVKAAQILGFRRVRLGVRWYQVESPRGRFTWRPFDDKVQALVRAGISPIIGVFGGNGGYPGHVSEGEALAGFARFAGAVAHRYGNGTPDRPILYEIWNEPNTKTFWGSPPDPEAYARMAEAACIAMKRDRPGVRVLALAMEGTPVKAPYFVPAYNIDIYQQWAGRAATPGLMRCADGFSMHPYFHKPEQQISDDPQLRAFIAAHWPQKVAPIIANTEVGYAISARHKITAEDQASLDLRTLLIGAGMGRVTNLYQSVDTARDTSNPADAFGLVTYDGQIKPAGAAVRRLLRAIGDYRIEGIDRGPAGAPSGYFRFSAQQGKKRARVLWATTPGRAKVEAGATVVDLVSGAAITAESDGSIPIGSAPVLVTWTD